MLQEKNVVRLRNLNWILRRHIDNHGWTGLFQRVIALLVAIRRRVINRLTISWTLFGWRSTLLSQLPVHVRMGEHTLFLAPRGSEAFHIWAHLRSERQEIEFVVNYLRQNMVFLDIGSNAGLYSIAAAKKFSERGKGIKVYAFEPALSTFELLKSNLHMNRADSVVPVHSALGDWQGVTTLFINEPGLDGLNTLSRPVRSDARPVAQEQVPITTLDAWLVENGVERVDLIKMDVEGAELKVLQGGKNLLQRPKAPLIFYESSLVNATGFDYHPVEIIWLLKEYGYEVYIFEQGRVTPRPQGQYDGMMVAAKAHHLSSLRIEEGV
jgi:FkbM family methyltransferase